MKHWYNNGKKEILSETQPEGWKKGRLYRKINHRNATISMNKKYHKNTQWYNNGEVEIIILLGADIPEGFIKGRLKSSCEKWLQCYLTEEQKYIFAHIISKKGAKARWGKKQ